MATKRSTTFATIAYPESFSKQFILSALDSLKISYFISPLHDSDLTDSGELKKPHYHVILVFDSLKSLSQIRDVIDDRFVGLEIVNSLRSYARYLCHLDNDDKAKYNPKDVVAHGLDYTKFLEEEYNKYDALESVIDYIMSSNTLSFSSLLLHAKATDKSMFRAIIDNSFTIREFIKSYKLDLSCARVGLDPNNT